MVMSIIKIHQVLSFLGGSPDIPKYQNRLFIILASRTVPSKDMVNHKLPVSIVLPHMSMPLLTFFSWPQILSVDTKHYLY